MNNILVIGAGTWGIAVSHLLCRNGHNVTVYGRNHEHIKKIIKTRTYDKLPGLLINKNIDFTSNLRESISNKNIIIFAVPSNAFRNVVNETVSSVNGKEYFITLTKGIENKTLFTMSEVIDDELKKKNINSKRIIALSGPTHAEEVAVDMPTMVVSASKNLQSAKYIQDVFMNDTFRVYTNKDIKGVELCAAFKNIIAISSGLLTGMGFGDNIKAATITRGIAEMVRAGKCMGCKKDTFYGLAGIGDMIVTATSIHSRNYKFGKLIGEGYTTEKALKKIGMVVEGYNFLPTAIKIKNKFKLDLPVTNGIYQIVINGEKPKKILKLLMTRSKKSE